MYITRQELQIESENYFWLHWLLTGKRFDVTVEEDNKLFIVHAEHKITKLCTVFRKKDLAVWRCPLFRTIKNDFDAFF